MSFKYWLSWSLPLNENETRVVKNVHKKPKQKIVELKI